MSLPYFIAALSLGVSIVSLSVSFWSVRKSTLNMRAEQSRFIDQQWQSLNHLILTNSDVASILAKKLNVSADEARSAQFDYYIVNALYISYNSWRLKTIDDDEFSVSVDGALEYMTPERLLYCANEGSYSNRFRKELSHRLVRLQQPREAKNSVNALPGGTMSDV